MEQKTSIRAIGRSLWIVALAVMVLGIPLFFGKASAGDLSDRIIFAIFIVTFGPYCIYRLCHDVYITEDGIECCRFGKVIRTLPWHQIAQVCIARNYRFSAKGSANTRIIITPRGCPAFSPQEWSGIRYLLTFRTQAVWIDNSPKNCALIEKYWGTITPLTFK